MKQRNLHNILSLIIATIVVVSCNNSYNLESDDNNYGTIRFGIDNITTRVSDSNEFEFDDRLGVYMFFNHFYYYYTEYNNFAESVIFSNQELIVQSSSSVSYSPLKTWTFSTVYGTAPHNLDIVAYYPYAVSDRVSFSNSTEDNGIDDTNNALFMFEYDATNISNHCDFMIAENTYNYSDDLTPDGSDDAEIFRNYILEQPYLTLTFKRKLASLNLKVSKEESITSDITVTGITVYFKADTLFCYNTLADSEAWYGKPSENKTVSVSCKQVLTATIDPTDPDNSGVEFDVDYLLSDNLYFPPNTEIEMVEFNIEGDGADGKSTYEWHPHMATIVENTHYTLNLELDPNRKN